MLGAEKFSDNIENALANIYAKYSQRVDELLSPSKISITEKKDVKVLVLGSISNGKTTFATQFSSLLSNIIPPDSLLQISILDSKSLQNETELQDLQNYKELLIQLNKGIDFVILLIDIKEKYPSILESFKLYQTLLTEYFLQHRFIILFNKLDNDFYFSLVKKNKWEEFKTTKISQLQQKFDLSPQLFIDFFNSLSLTSFINNEINVDSNANVFSYSQEVTKRLYQLFKEKGQFQMKITQYPLLSRFQNIKRYLVNYYSSHFSEIGQQKRVIEKKISQLNSEIENLERLEISKYLVDISELKSLSPLRSEISFGFDYSKKTIVIEKDFCKGYSNFLHFTKNCAVIYKIKKSISRSQPIQPSNIIRWFENTDNNEGTINVIISPIQENKKYIYNDFTNESIGNNNNNKNDIINFRGNNFNDEKEVKWYYCYELYSEIEQQKIDKLQEQINCVNNIIEKKKLLIEYNQQLIYQLNDVVRENLNHFSQLHFLHFNPEVLSLLNQDLYSYSEFLVMTDLMEKFILDNNNKNNNNNINNNNINNNINNKDTNERGNLIKEISLSQINNLNEKENKIEPIAKFKHYQNIAAIDDFSLLVKRDIFQIIG